MPAPVLSAPSLPSSLTALAIPTSLRPGVWAEQILKFETQWNPPREFPVKVLLGSEAILARLLRDCFQTLHSCQFGRDFSQQGVLFQWLGQSSGYEARRRPGPWVEDSYTARLRPQVDLARHRCLGCGEVGICLGRVRHRRRRRSPHRPMCSFRNGSAPRICRGIKSLHAAASWELCLLMRAGETFDIAVNDVMTRTHWLREYLDDFKLESRKDAGTRYDEDNVEPEGRPAKSKGKGKFDGKFDRTFGPRKRLTRSRSRREASRRRSPRDSMVSSTRRSRSRKHSRSLRWVFHQEGIRGAANKGKVVPCQDYQRGKCTVQGPCPKGFIHKCSVYNSSGHGSTDCWYR